MKPTFLTLISFLFAFALHAQSGCELSVTHGHGFTTHIASVSDNCDGTHTISLRIEHDGCGGPNCKDLSNFAVEAISGTYTNVSVTVNSGSMTYGNLDLGPNIGGKIPFNGFKVDGISGIGNGKAGSFTISYTLSGGFQTQRVSAKPGSKVLVKSFSNNDFNTVMHCQGNTCGSNNGTGAALGFNVFVEEDAKLETNETEGPVAIGRDLIINGNYQVSTNQTGTFSVWGIPTTLVVGKKVIFRNGNSLQVNQNGYAKIGECGSNHVWYKDMNGASAPIRVTKNNWYNTTPYLHLQANAQQLGVSATQNPICQPNVLDFAQAFLTLRDNSSQYSACSHNAQLTDPNGNAIPNSNLPNQVKINLQQGRNVLNISGTDLNNVSVFTYNQKPSANQFLIINVDAPGTFDWDVWNQAGVGQQDAQYILYNFFNTTKLNIKGNATIEGTILAPNADINKVVNQANIEGQVIAKSFFHKGGEVHYAVFQPNDPGCAVPPPLPTVSRFWPDQYSACLSGNTISFTNASTGEAPLTYYWSFGDGDTSTQISPIHSYNQSGTYQVMLAVNGLGGTDTSYETVVIHPNPNGMFSVNDTIQAFTNNSFLFTPSQIIAGQQYQWNFGDGNSSTATAPTKSYAAIGAYSVSLNLTDKNGCVSGSTLLVAVESDSSSGGNGGGIESESLEGKLSLLHYQKAKNSIPSFSLAKAPAFDPNATKGYKVSGAGSKTLEKFIPASLPNGIGGVVTSPSHLLPITNAKEIVSVDYVDQMQTKAVVLASVTYDEPYNHTKYTCDRFLQGELTYLSPVNLQGVILNLFSIKRYDGNTEYGMEFSVGFDSSDTSFALQSGWLINQYVEKDTVYNFQVWSTNPKTTQHLAKKLIQNLQSEKTVVEPYGFDSPKVYVTKGSRKEGKLTLTVKNTTPDPYLTVKWCEKKNEQVGFDTSYTYVVTEDSSVADVTFEVGDNYEFDVYFYLNGELQDKVYMADANWGLDYVGTFTTVDEYTISNNESVDYKGDYPLYRNVLLKAKTEDYISIFKDLTAGTLPTNLSSYAGLQFYAEGEDTVIVRLSSSNITNWRAQYTTEITLTPDGKWYQLPFSAFQSDSFSTPIPTEALSTLTFSYVSQSHSEEEVSIKLKNVAFVDEFVIASQEEEEEKTQQKGFSIAPNPTQGEVVLRFDLSVDQPVALNVLDIEGKLLFTKNANGLKGQNVQLLSTKQMGLSKGIYFVSLQTQSGEVYFEKLVVQ